MMADFFWPMLLGRAPSMLPIYGNFLISVAWSYLVMTSLLAGIAWSLGVSSAGFIRGFELVPQWWGLTLAITYLAQALVSHLIERRYERGGLSTMFWIIWYPLAFWLISVLTTVVAVPRALLRPRAEHTTWVSPDRGVR